jgi:uncharacterized Zn-binding protein involved in type VI secretion
MPAVLWGGLDIAAAQQPGAVLQGSPDVTVGGKPAARGGDSTTSGAPIVEGSRDVFINGRPAALSGGRTGCGGVVVGGSSNVFINGKPVAQAGSPTTDCPGR